MDLAENIPGFTKTDRLGLTAFGSVLLHMVIILGIGFTLPKINANDPLPILDITLVNTRSDIEPKKADFLAQASQEGGGDVDQAVIAKSPLPLNLSPNLSEQVPLAQLPSSEQEQQAVDELITQDETETQQINVQQTQEQQFAQQSEATPGLDQPSQKNQERARLSAEISQFWQEYQKRPRRKFLSARTKEYKYAGYMEAWRTKVERVGNLNYPERAKQKDLTGSLVLDVEIKPSGAVHNITVVKASGSKVLDDAAIRIVKLAAPYEPFPTEFKQEIDILHITRTWQFLSGNKLVSR